MSKEQAVKYCLNVLTKWTAFCGSHKKFSQAIKALIDECNVSK